MFFQIKLFQGSVPDRRRSQSAHCPAAFTIHYGSGIANSCPYLLGSLATHSKMIFPGQHSPKQQLFQMLTLLGNLWSCERIDRTHHCQSSGRSWCKKGTKVICYIHFTPFLLFCFEYLQLSRPKRGESDTVEWRKSNEALGVSLELRSRCTYCLKTMLAKDELENHYKTVHPGLDYGIYMCSHCNKIFRSIEYLERHERVHQVIDKYKLILYK